MEGGDKLFRDMSVSKKFLEVLRQNVIKVIKQKINKENLMKTEKIKIEKDNIVRIYNSDLLDILNDEYLKMQDIEHYSKNAFLNDVLRLGIKVLKKQNDDNWAIKNETTTLLEAIHEHTKTILFPFCPFLKYTNLQEFFLNKKQELKKYYAYKTE